MLAETCVAGARIVVLGADIDVDHRIAADFAKDRIPRGKVSHDRVKRVIRTGCAKGEVKTQRKVVVI